MLKTLSHPQSKTYESAGLKLHYLEWGNPESPALLLLHGMHDHARSWDAIAQAMCGKWRIIAPDLRGHGDSEWSPDGAYHTPYYLLDLARLIESLGRERVSMVAHSLGGNPAARYAALYPQRVERLVLVDAMGPTAPAIEQWDRQGVVHRTREWLEKRADLESRQPRLFGSIEEAATRMSKIHRRLSADQIHHLTEHGLRCVDGKYCWKYDPRAGTFHPEDFSIHLSQFWREITAPTLICWGPESWTTNPEKDGSVDSFQCCETQTFEGAGHWIHHDQPDAFVEVASRFLIDT